MTHIWQASECAHVSISITDGQLATQLESGNWNGLLRGAAVTRRTKQYTAVSIQQCPQLSPPKTKSVVVPSTVAIIFPLITWPIADHTFDRQPCFVGLIMGKGKGIVRVRIASSCKSS